MKEFEGKRVRGVRTRLRRAHRLTPLRCSRISAFTSPISVRYASWNDLCRSVQSASANGFSNSCRADANLCNCSLRNSTSSVAPVLKNAFCEAVIASILSCGVFFIVIFSSGKVIHCVIDSKDSAKNKIKQANGQNCLPESYEMETERYAAEIPVLFN